MRLGPVLIRVQFFYGSRRCFESGEILSTPLHNPPECAGVNVLHSIDRTHNHRVSDNRVVKGKITLSFASPEKENLYIYIYDMITWNFFVKLSEHYYSYGIRLGFSSPV